MYSARCKKCGLVEREGMGCVWSSFPVAFFKVRKQPNFIECMRFKDNLIKIKQRVIKALSRKRRKKTIKKLVNLNYS